MRDALGPKGVHCVHISVKNIRSASTIYWGRQWLVRQSSHQQLDDGVMIWKRIPHYLPFLRGIHKSLQLLVENISNDFAEVKRNKRKTIDDYLKVWYQIPQLQHNDIWRFLFLLESSHRNNIITWCQSDSLALEFARDLHLNLESKVLQKRTRYWFR